MNVPEATVVLQVTEPKGTCGERRSIPPRRIPDHAWGCSPAGRGRVTPRGRAAQRLPSQETAWRRGEKETCRGKAWRPWPQQVIEVHTQSPGPRRKCGRGSKCGGHLLCVLPPDPQPSLTLGQTETAKCGHLSDPRAALLKAVGVLAAGRARDTPSPEDPGEAGD